MTLLYVFPFICSYYLYICLNFNGTEQLYSNSNININFNIDIDIDDDNSAMNKGTGSLSKRMKMAISSKIFKINKMHGNLQDPIFLKK
jgi:hypothetical protein